MTTAQSAVELSKINLLESARLNLEALLFHFRGQGHLLEKSFQAFQKEVEKAQGELRSTRTGREYLYKMSMFMDGLRSRVDRICLLDKALKEVSKAYLELRRAEVAWSKSMRDNAAKCWARCREVARVEDAGWVGEEYVEHPEVVEFVERYQNFKAIIESGSGEVKETPDSLLDRHLPTKELAKDLGGGGTGSPLKIIRQLNEGRGSNSTLRLGTAGAASSSPGTAAGRARPPELLLHFHLKNPDAGGGIKGAGGSSANLKSGASSVALLQSLGLMYVTVSGGEDGTNEVARTNSVSRGEYNTEFEPVNFLISSFTEASGPELSSVPLTFELRDGSSAKGAVLFRTRVPLGEVRTGWSAPAVDPRGKSVGTLTLAFVGRLGAGIPRAQTAHASPAKLARDDMRFRPGSRAAERLSDSEDDETSTTGLKDQMLSLQLKATLTTSKKVDPYVAVKRCKPDGSPGQTVHETEAITKSVKPMWEPFTVVLADLVKEGAGGSVERAPFALSVFDQDLGIDDLIGTALVNLHVLKTGASFQLVSGSGAEVGTLQVVMASRLTKAQAVKESAEREAKKKAPAPDLGNLELELRANLVGTSGKVDPYLVLKLVKQDGKSRSSALHETEPVKKTTTPTWRPFAVDVKALIAELPAAARDRPLDREMAQIAFEVMDSDFGIDDDLGSALTTLGALVSGAVIPITHMNKPAGTITVVAARRSVAPLDADGRPVSRKNRVRMGIAHNAVDDIINHVSSSLDGLSFTAHTANVKKDGDLYLVARGGGDDAELFRTETAPKSRSASWKPTSAALEPIKAAGSFTLSLMDEDFGRDDTIGSCTVALADIFTGASIDVRDKNGRVTGTVVFDKVSKNGKETKPVASENLSVELAIESESKNDYYVAIEHGDQRVMRTETAPKGLTASWSFTLPAEPFLRADSRGVTFRVMDEDMGRDDAVGSFTCPLSAIKSGYAVPVVESGSGKRAATLTFSRVAKNGVELKAAPVDLAPVNLEIRCQSKKKADLYLLIKRVTDSGKKVGSEPLYKSEVAPKGTAADWKPINLPAVELQGPLVFVVMDEEFGRDDEVGSVRTTLEELKTGAVLSLIGDGQESGQLTLTKVSRRLPKGAAEASVAPTASAASSASSSAAAATKPRGIAFPTVSPSSPAQAAAAAADGPVTLTFQADMEDKNDLYLVVRSKGDSNDNPHGKTATKKSTKSASWDPLSLPSAKALGAGEIVIAVMDEDWGKDDLVGLVSTTLADLTPRASFPVINSKGKKVGTLNLVDVEKPKPAQPPQQKLPRVSPRDSSMSMRTTSAEDASAIEVAITGTVFTPSNLFVTVSAHDGEDAVDPPLHKTSVESKVKSATWPPFSIDPAAVKKQSGSRKDPKLCFRLLNKTSRGEALVGEVIISLSKLASGPHALRNDDETVGSLELSVHDPSHPAANRRSSSAMRMSSSGRLPDLSHSTSTSSTAAAASNKGGENAKENTALKHLKVIFMAELSLKKRTEGPPDSYLIIKTKDKEIARSEVSRNSNEPEFDEITIDGKSLGSGDDEAAKLSLEIYEESFGSDVLLASANVTTSQIKSGASIPIADKKGRPAGSLAVVKASRL